MTGHDLVLQSRAGQVTCFAVIGAGTIGTVHARNVAAHPRFRLGYVIDRDLGRAEALARATGAIADRSPDAALADETVDAVIIASSTSAHEEHALACAAAGKPFICEKPVSDNLPGAVACAEAAARAGVVAAMGLNRRLDADMRDLAERIRGGEIGDVESMHVVSRSASPPAPESVPFSGGMIREKGAHFYDLACWLAGSEPVEVYATGGCLIDPRLGEYGDVDTAALVVRFESGALVTFQFGRRTAYGQDEWLEVFGSDGMLTAGRKREGTVELFRGRAVAGSGILADTYAQFAASYVEELEVFARALAGQGPVHATLADGVRAQAIAEAALVSLRDGRSVPIDRVW